MSALKEDTPSPAEAVSYDDAPEHNGSPGVHSLSENDNANQHDPPPFTQDSLDSQAIIELQGFNDRKVWIAEKIKVGSRFSSAYVTPCRFPVQ